MSEHEMTNDKALNENHTIRTCQECGVAYSLEEAYQHSAVHFDPPDHYDAGCDRYCLACWLGVGPNDFPPDPDQEALETAWIPRTTQGYSPGAGLWGTNS